MTRGPKTYIYGPRIKGDIDLGYEPSRIDGAGERAWARMDFPGTMLAGGSDQLITESSTTQNFAIGTRRIEYGRTFRYSKVGTTLTSAANARLCKNGNFEPDSTSYEDTYGFYGDLLTAASIGDTYVDLEESSAGRAANAFQGGYFTCFDTNYSTYYIVKSDASTSTYTRIYLDHPLTQAISATNGVQVYYSPYSNIIDGLTGQSYTSFVGRCLAGNVAANSYFWLQTAGTCWITPYNWTTGCPGYAANKRDCYAWIDGTVTVATTVGELQRVGYLLAGTESAIGSTFTMLQLE